MVRATFLLAAAILIGGNVYGAIQTASDFAARQRCATQYVLVGFDASFAREACKL